MRVRFGSTAAIEISLNFRQICTGRHAGPTTKSATEVSRVVETEFQRKARHPRPPARHQPSAGVLEPCLVDERSVRGSFIREASLECAGTDTDNVCKLSKARRLAQIGGGDLSNGLWETGGQPPRDRSPGM